MFMLRANLVLDSGSILGAWQGDTAEGNTAYVPQLPALQNRLYRAGPAPPSHVPSPGGVQGLGSCVQGDLQAS